MTDIVERLRIQHREGLMFVPDGHVNVSFGDAADEIERLREALGEAADCLGWCAVPGRMSVEHYTGVVSGFEQDARAALKGK